MRWSLLLTLCLVFPAGLSAQDQEKPEAKKETKPKSLAQLAREARARRDKGQSAKLITNADLATLRSRVSTAEPPPEEAPPEGGEEDASGAEAGAEQPPAGEETLSDEEMAAWQARFDQARLDLTRLVNEGSVLQLRMNSLRNQFLTVNDGPTQARLGAQLEENQTRIEENREAQDEARLAITALQNEARDAGLTRRQIEELTGSLPNTSSSILDNS